jgi:DNA-binding YbaB/EbfC family protein
MEASPMDDETAPAVPDMSSLLGMAMEMQQQLQAAQDEVAQALIEGQSGGGVVRIEVTGDLEFRSVKIAPEAVDPGDIEMLEALVLAALHDVSARVQELARGVNPMAGLDLGNLDIGGLDLGELGGILGLGAPEGGPLDIDEIGIDETGIGTGDDTDEGDDGVADH